MYLQSAETVREDINDLPRRNPLVCVKLSSLLIIYTFCYILLTNSNVKLSTKHSIDRIRSVDTREWHLRDGMQRRPAHNPNDPGAGSDLRKVPAIVSELIPAKKAYGLVVEGRPPPGLDRGGFETQQHTLHGYTKGQITPSKPSERIILFHSTPQQISTRYQAAARFSHERYSIRNTFENSQGRTLHPSSESGSRNS
eukprot:3812816-Pyramimonas_sp.AAC.1